MTNPVKDREHETWTRVAPGWAKHDEHLRTSQAAVTEKILATVALATGERVLDIACGTGEPAIPAAERVGPHGSVVATDFVEEMLAFARQKAARKGLRNIEFRRVDGEVLDVPGGAFDVVTIRWGLMFMPDPRACLVRAFEALRLGGRIAVTCWAGPEKNPWVSLPVSVLKRHMEVPTPPPGAPGMFAFADPALLKTTLESAGFSDVVVEEVPTTMGGRDFPDGARFVTYMRELAGPLARLFDALPPEKQRQVERELASEIDARFRAGDHVSLPGVTWLARGVRK